MRVREVVGCGKKHVTEGGSDKKQIETVPMPTTRLTTQLMTTTRLTSLNKYNYIKNCTKYEKLLSCKPQKINCQLQLIAINCNRNGLFLGFAPGGCT